MKKMQMATKLARGAKENLKIDDDEDDNPRVLNENFSSPSNCDLSLIFFSEGKKFLDVFVCLLVNLT